jgi:LCP family protein required for cell wall assembly
LKGKRISKIGLVFVVIAVYFTSFAMGSFLCGCIYNGNTTATLPVISFGNQRLNILIMGIDARSNETNSRSDTMIVASIDKKTKQTVMVWVPRDTRVETSPGHYDKINSVNYLQGPEQACKVTGDLLGINIKYYVVTNFEGFDDIVDSLGGVHINVESRMYHPDPDPRLAINLQPGPQLLDGENALKYVRYRGGPTADIGRTARQANFIKALMKEMISTRTITKLPDLLPTLLEYVHTNLPMKEMVNLATMAKDFSLENVITQTLPGYPHTDPKTGASYWYADEKIARNLIDALFKGETFEVMSDPPKSAAPAGNPIYNNTEETSNENTEELEDPALENEETESESGTAEPGDSNMPPDEGDFPADPDENMSGGNSEGNGSEDNDGYQPDDYYGGDEMI